MTKRGRRFYSTFLFYALLQLVSAPGFAVEIIGTHYGSLLTCAPLAVALERGDFDRHGVQVSGIATSEGGGTTLRNFFAGDLPYGEVSTSAALLAFRQGRDVKLVNASVVSLADLLWITMPNSGITSIQGLKGKRIGITSPKSTSQTAVEMSLEAAGIPVDGVKLIATGAVGSGLSAVEQGGVDAALILEPLWSAREDRYRVAFRPADLLPPMTQTVGVTTKKFSSEHPDMVRAIIAARRDAVDFIYAHPEEAAKMIAKRYGQTLPEPVAIRAVQHMVDIRYWSPGNFDMVGLDAWVKGMERQGDWSGPVDWTKIIDRSFLPADLRGPEGG